MDYQFPEVTASRDSDHRLHRSSLRFPLLHSKTSRGQIHEGSTTDQPLSVDQHSSSSPLGQPSGAPYIMSGPDLHGTFILTPIANSCQSILDQQRPAFHSNSSDTLVQNSHQLVAGSRSCNVRSTMATPSTSGDPNNRLIGQGVRSNLRSPTTVRDMGPCHSAETYQFQRTVRSMESSSSLGEHSHEQVRHGGLGQCYHDLLLEQTRRHQIPRTFIPNNSDPGVVCSEGNISPLSVPSWSAQCNFRQTLQEGSDSQHRVDTPPDHFPENQSHHSPNDRPVCDFLQPPASTVLLPSSRPSSPGDRCSQSTLVTHDSVCISPIPAHSQSTHQTANRSELQSAARVPQMASKNLVSHSAVNAQRHTPINSTDSQIVETASELHIPQQSGPVQSARVATIKQSLIAEGFSERPADSISKRTKSSTEELYQGKWEHYTSWCMQREVDPLQATIAQICDFFDYLFFERKLSPSAIDGYRSTISMTLLLTSGIQISKDIRINSQLKHFHLSRPRVTFKPPKWDLVLVLNSLLKAPYEPITSCNLKYLTYKTVFLVAFATAARINELHALSFEKLAYSRHWQKVTLETRDDFLAKNQSVLDSNSRSFTIPSLYNFVDSDSPDRLLCPVRALRLYVHKTAHLRAGKQNLFVSFHKNKTNDITKGSISNWIKTVIKFAYDNVNDFDRDLVNVTAHEVRALSSSIAYNKSLSLSAINNSCSWKGHNTFTNFYLRDIAFMKNDLLTLPNIVVSQTKYKS